MIISWPSDACLNPAHLRMLIRLTPYAPPAKTTQHSANNPAHTLLNSRLPLGLANNRRACTPYPAIERDGDTFQRQKRREQRNGFGVADSDQKLLSCQPRHSSLRAGFDIVLTDTSRQPLRQ